LSKFNEPRLSTPVAITLIICVTIFLITLAGLIFAATIGQKINFVFN